MASTPPTSEVVPRRVYRSRGVAIMNAIACNLNNIVRCSLDGAAANERDFVTYTATRMVETTNDSRCDGGCRSMGL